METLCAFLLGAAALLGLAVLCFAALAIGAWEAEHGEDTERP